MTDKISGFPHNCSLDLIHKGNSLIFEVSTNPLSDNPILKITYTNELLSSEEQTVLRNEGIIPKPFFFRETEGELNLNITLIPKYPDDLLTFLSKKFPKDSQVDSNTKILTCLPFFQTMGQMLLRIKDNKIFFPDAKIQNWLINDNALVIADTKSLRLFNKTGNMDVSPMMMAPETQELNPPLSDKDIDKAHVYLLALNIIVGMYPHETNEYHDKSPEELKAFRQEQIKRIGNPELEKLLSDCIEDVPDKRPTLQLAQMQLKKIELDIKKGQNPSDQDITSAFEKICLKIEIEKLKKHLVAAPDAVSQLSTIQTKLDTNNDVDVKWIKKLIKLYEKEETALIAQHIYATVERLQSSSYDFFNKSGRPKALNIQKEVANLDTDKPNWAKLEAALKENRGWFSSSSANKFKIMKATLAAAKPKEETVHNTTESSVETSSPKAPSFKK